MTVKTLLEALLIDWVRRNMRRGERTTPSGQRLRGQVRRDPTTARWNWWVSFWVEPPPDADAHAYAHAYWVTSGWTQGARGDALTRLGAIARVRVALRAYEHGTELIH